jgi:K+-sensing histidine kinase KdpD
LKEDSNQIKEQDQLQVLFEEVNSLLHEKVKHGKQEIIFQKDIMNRLKKTHIKKDDLFEDINQDVRTNLVVIKAYADMLKSQKFGDLTTTQQEKITKIQESADELTESFLKILEKLKNVKEETPNV